MKLNPTKFSFGEEEDKFLGHIVMPRGIKANLKKIEAVERMSSQKSRKEVQSLPDKWIEEAEKAFVEMKSLLRELPTLTAPITGETLMVQMPVYFVSKALSGIEVNYPPFEKLVYALPEVSSRLAKWAIELGEHEINYSPRMTIKSQILTDYLAKTTGEVEALAESPTISCDENQVWELHIDGACGVEGAGTGLVLTSPVREEYTYTLRFMFTVTNNESEYEALLSGMRIAQQLGIKHLDTYVDSQLVANHVNGLFGVHEASTQCIYTIIACSGGINFLVVVIDYVTKWVEAKALAAITGRRIRNFLWEDIVCRFGIPNEIVSDNGTQFEGEPFKSWCQELNIKQSLTSVTHPHANGQYEVTNRDILKGIKVRLSLYSNEWVDELPSVLWVHLTTHKNSTGETPFSLVNGTEAVIPAELMVLIKRIRSFEESSNDEGLRTNLNMLEERREIAAIREAISKQKISKYYDKRV
ncbi:uncharacterized protein [Rutidosis leptorrhynchoides]|uniref:uncharacterized protein n=1 Tax=Rutidosis leptorrhynchoides TaxID=125765 RepID=UPI003A99CEA0